LHARGRCSEGLRVKRRQYTRSPINRHPKGFFLKPAFAVLR
jgi:hypothetical protein